MHRPEVGSAQKRSKKIEMNGVKRFRDRARSSLSGPADSLTTAVERGHHRDGPTRTGQRFSQDLSTTVTAAEDYECSKTKADKDLWVIDRAV